MSTMIQGHRMQLAPGVLVRNVTLSHNSVGNYNDMIIELSVDPHQVNAVDSIIQGLQQLTNGTHPIQQFHVMTSAVTPTTNSPWVGEVVLDEIEGEMERDPDDLEDPVTLLTLKELIEERFDGIDSAIRLAIGE